MNTRYALLLSFLLCSVSSNTVHACSDALNYTPIVSDTSKILVGGAGLTVGAALFLVLNTIRAKCEGKTYHRFSDAFAGAINELCKIAFSPLKALLSVAGIKTKSVKYPSAQSYFNFAVSALSGYLTAKYAFTYTPEGKFIAGQSELKEILNDPTGQRLLNDQDNNLVDNINRTFVENDRPLIKGHSYILSIRNALKNAYDKLTGAQSIQDTTAQGYLADMQHIAHTQIESTGSALTQIKQTPGWESMLKAAQEAFDRAQELRLLQQRVDCENNKAWALHRQADATNRLAHAQWHAQHPHHTYHSTTPGAYPPTY